MKIYLAAPFSQASAMKLIASDLKQFGHTVTSRWILGGHEWTDETVPREIAARFAAEDVEDVLAADCLVCFTLPQHRGRGGRHVEFGIAIQAGKRILLVGEWENVFQCLPSIEHYPDWATARVALAFAEVTA